MQVISFYVANGMQPFNRAVLGVWYFTPGGALGGFSGSLDKHIFVTGKRTGRSPGPLR